VETIAMVRLLMGKWCEPPESTALHLSTLVQQLLSLVAQYGGAKAEEAWRVLCRDGAFQGVTAEVFAQFLRSLGGHDLIVQSADGTLLLGEKGERIVNHYSFYSAFVTAEEYQLVCRGQSLGTLPISHPLSPGCYLIFAGQRWQVVNVDPTRRIVDLEPSPAGRAPKFSGGGAFVHERIRQEMKAVYESTDVPAFLDAGARTMLDEGRSAYSRFGLGKTSLVEYDGNVALFAWAGDRVVDTLLVQLRDRELPVARDGIALVLSETSRATAMSHLTALAAQGPADSSELAVTVANKVVEKLHPYLNEELLSLDYASAYLDTDGAWTTVVRLVAEGASAQ
jgi:ATP-dependent Lhr-like helicase